MVTLYNSSFNGTDTLFSSTTYESTEWQTTGPFPKPKPMKITRIPNDPATEAILALISCSIAVLILFLYIKDLIAAGVCRKRFRHIPEDSPTNNERYWIAPKVGNG